MSDIFISYASDDRERIMPLVRALENTGWSIFWDRTIPTGKHWRQVIGKEIRDCRSVIVVWSKTSVESDYVQEEAGEGKKRGILFPIMIDDFLPPFGFSEIQAQNLTGWDGTVPHPAYDRLVNDITALLGIPPVAVEEERKQKEAEAKRRIVEEEHKAEAERKIQEEERQRKEQIAGLYEKALALVRLQEWKEVSEKMKEIQALDPQFADPKGLFTRVQEEEARLKAEEAQKRKEEEAKRRVREKTKKEEIKRKAKEEQLKDKDKSVERRPSSRKILIVGSLAIVLMVIILGMILWINFQKQRKQDNTVEDIIKISDGIQWFITDYGIAPEQNGIYEEDSIFYKALSPFYVKYLPIRDKWGNHYRVYCGKACDGKYGISNSKDTDFLIVSYGRDGEKETMWEFNSRDLDAGLYDKSHENLDTDLINWNGHWIRTPKLPVDIP